MRLNNMDQLKIIADNIKLLADVSNNPPPFWNTQWFSALIGALSALLISWFKDSFSARRNRMLELYDYFSKSGHWFSTESILSEAAIHHYGGSMIKDGETTVLPEKTLSEKMIIQLRTKCKYWTYPICKLRFLFARYERAISKIPNLRVHEVKKTAEYINADAIYNKIQNLAYVKTGESMWTAKG